MSGDSGRGLGQTRRGGDRTPVEQAIGGEGSPGGRTRARRSSRQAWGIDRGVISCSFTMCYDLSESADADRSPALIGRGRLPIGTRAFKSTGRRADHGRESEHTGGKRASGPVTRESLHRPGELL